MNKLIATLIAIAVLGSLAGCNTFYGVGQDLESAGKGLQKTSEAVEDEITDER